MARTNTVIIKGGGIGIDTSDFRVVATALRRAGSETTPKLRRNLRAAGELVAEEARQISSENSKSVPPSIKVRVASTTVSIVAGGPGVPVAGLFEEGNKGGATMATFRHPVYGNKDVWVDQAKHPFLREAAERKLPEVELLVVSALDDAVKTIAFGE